MQGLGSRRFYRGANDEYPSPSYADGAWSPPRLTGLETGGRTFRPREFGRD